MPIFKHCVIASTGDFGPGKRDDQMKKWVTNNGGKWAVKPGKGMTHLICSKEFWKKGGETIKLAKQVGAHIVTFDWLEDSCMNKRKKSEKKYSLVTIENLRRTRKHLARTAEKADRDRFASGCAQAEKELKSGKKPPPLKSPPKNGFFRSAMADLAEKRAKREAEATAMKSISATGRSLEGSLLPSTPAPASASQLSPAPSQTFSLPRPPSLASSSSSAPKAVQVPLKTSRNKGTDISGPRVPTIQDLYHVYMDSMGFEYNITLVRTQLSTNTNSRYNIRMYESHTIPHVYCTLVRYSPAGTKNWPSIDGASVTSPALASQDKPKDIMEQATNFVKPEPFKRLIASFNSDYTTALAAFRHAFEDLTFLKWEDRYGTSSTSAHDLQVQMALQHDLEPFIYCVPAAGLPRGAMPQIPFEETYTWGSMGLAGMDQPVNSDCKIGGIIAKREEERIERENNIKREEEEKLKIAKEKARQISRKPDLRYKPLFNGVMGKVDDAHRRHTVRKPRLQGAVQYRSRWENSYFDRDRD